MRGAFLNTLLELAERDPRVFFLTGDLGFWVVEPFAAKFPDRFINVGVAEQNMVGIATGLAESGLMPFVYSIVTFATLRAYEFIRNGPVLHGLPVRIVGVGGGVEYSHNGPTHFGLEDVGVMRVQPGLTVIAPADAAQTRNALLSTWDMKGPIYYRLGKDDKAAVPGLNGEFDIERVQRVRSGEDLLIVAMGSIATEACAAAEELAKQGVSCAVAVVSCLNPAPVRDLADLLSGYQRVICVEAHYANGGLGSLVAEVIAENGINCRLTRSAVKENPHGVIGSQDFLYRKYGISRASLIEVAMQSLDLAKK
ncbi:MAG TPA: transketolase C-terminal domain-containing protein [Candidatus Obscuribacterales bacterium]